MTRDENAFDDILQAALQYPPIQMAVAHPCSPESLLGAVESAEAGLIDPVLVGPRAKIEAVAAAEGIDITPYRLVDTPHSHASAEKAVEIVRLGEAHSLMKGSLHTDEFMKAVLNRTTGVRTDRRISHAFIMKVESYPRYLFITDAAINIAPDLTTKAHIAQNAIDLCHALGVKMPKVAILAAVETVTPSMQATVEAAALCKMADRHQITGAILDGPLAFDNAISHAAADTKGIDSPVAGDPDILLVPNMEAGNMLSKQLSYLAAAASAGVVLGARVPIVLTSRSDDSNSRMASAAIAALVAHRRVLGTDNNA